MKIEDSELNKIETCNKNCKTCELFAFCVFFYGCGENFEKEIEEIEK